MSSKSIAALTAAMLSSATLAFAAPKQDSFSHLPGTFTSHPAESNFINFDDGAVGEGSILSNQYAAMGVHFLPNHTASGVPNPPSGSPFATNSAMDITNNNFGGGIGAPLSGFVLHSLFGWSGENGNPTMTMVFNDRVQMLRMDVGGNAYSDSGIFAVDTQSNAVYDSSFAPSGVNVTMILTPSTPTTTFVIVMGAFDDWVGIDNISWTRAPVPEPGTLTILVALASLALRRR